jgi:thiosulfate/3-mercaptopyruvate sulfurtransferase
LFADLKVEGDPRTTYLKPPADFAALMGRCGVSNDTTVVVYDDRGGVRAARLWWMLRYYGHEDVRVLNGGLSEWIKQGKPLESGSVTPVPASFTPRVHSRLIATRSEVEAALHEPAVAIVDTLPRRYFTGLLTLTPEQRAGHIPRAVNLPAPDLVHEASDLILSPDELTHTFEQAHLQPEQRIITYCGAGVYACFTTFALYLMGYENVGMYDGSRAEWYSQPELPVTVDSSE